MTIDGILNINKPKGKTSFEIVSLVRRLSGERKVGHAGTLDPDATGVLLVCLGQGTRVVEFLTKAKKCYLAKLQLGISTDTYDASGRVTHKGEFSQLTKEHVEKALSAFTGFIDQIPPMYSAVKYHGKPLYRLARAGIEVPRKARSVEVSRLEIIDWQPPLFTLEGECSKGTYIRSLAHDLGQKLGCGAHLKDLVRLKSGSFHINDAITIPELENAFKQGIWAELIHPIDVALLHLTAVTVDEEDELAVTNGRTIALTKATSVASQLCRAYSHDKRFLAILRYCPETENWRPEKVFQQQSIAKA
ncbi:tRNA pseudouridine(55) synthase TruB [Chloroflexota bacterium]